MSFSLVAPLCEPFASSAFRTSMPLTTSPNSVCLPSSHGVGTNVRKNWLPSLFGMPVLAIESMPGRVCFTGDAVLGTGSVFVAPGPGSLAGYLAALRRLRALPLELLCPGHGPPVDDPAAKLDEYLAHRLDRERRLLDALARGLRSEGELLDDVWDDAPTALRFAAGVTLRAHLEKLSDEGRLPAGVEIPARELGDAEL